MTTTFVTLLDFIGTFAISGALVERMRNPVQLFDAVGLGLFAVLGANKALNAGVGPVAGHRFRRRLGRCP